MPSLACSCAGCFHLEQESLAACLLIHAQATSAQRLHPPACLLSLAARGRTSLQDRPGVWPGLCWRRHCVGATPRRACLEPRRHCSQLWGDSQRHNGGGGSAGGPCGAAGGAGGGAGSGILPWLCNGWQARAGLDLATVGCCIHCGTCTAVGTNVGGSGLAHALNQSALPTPLLPLRSSTRTAAPSSSPGAAASL